MSKFLEIALIAALAATPALAEGLGRPATEAEIAAWDIDIRPDGQGLPEGSGTVSDGEMIYTERCAACHGDFGEARGRWPQLAGGFDTLDGSRPVKTVGSYWPYLSTVWDYVHRAMPFGNAQSLSDDEVYALTAYILYLNDIVTEDDFELSRENFTEIAMPNADGFFMDDREEAEFPEFTGEVCMENCKESVEITMRAKVLDVTPDGEEAPDDSAAAPDGQAQVEVATAEEGGEAAAEADAAAAAPSPEMIAAGEKVFRKCQACHQVGEGAQNRVGPELNDLFGRTAGSVEGFKYSGAMKDAGIVWDHDTLSGFLEDPKAYVAGTRMSFRGLDSAEDIDALLAYLAAKGGS